MGALNMKKKILIIDDADELIELTRRILTSRGYEVIGLTDGDVAIQTIKKESPDLVIIDMILPGKHGTEICHEIKSNETIKQMPVIISTGQFIDEDITRSAEGFKQADDYLSKPFEIEDLLAKIRNLVGH